MRLITIEGCEGSGKTTQAKMLTERLNKLGIEAIYTREPGGIDSAEEIRSLLINGEVDKFLPITELLLHNAARYEHAIKVIEPALKAGKFVICDRFVDSTMAYQGYGHQIGKKIPAILHNICLPGITPDLTFVLDMNPEASLSRRMNEAGTENRYEHMDMKFHERVYRGFLDIVKMAPDRCILIDADRSVDSISDAILNHMEMLFELETGKG